MTFRIMTVLCLSAVLSGCSNEASSYDDKAAADTVAAAEKAADEVIRQIEPSPNIEVDNSSTAISSENALRIIKDAGHVCDRVVAAEPKSDSTIATCDDGEKYRVAILTEPARQELAMKCSAMEKLGVEGGC